MQEEWERGEKNEQERHVPVSPSKYNNIINIYIKYNEIKANYSIVVNLQHGEV